MSDTPKKLSIAEVKRRMAERLANGVDADGNPVPAQNAAPVNAAGGRAVEAEDVPLLREIEERLTDGTVKDAVTTLREAGERAAANAQELPDLPPDAELIVPEAHRNGAVEKPATAHLTPAQKQAAAKRRSRIEHAVGNALTGVRTSITDEETGKPITPRNFAKKVGIDFDERYKHLETSVVPLTRAEHDQIAASVNGEADAEKVDALTTAVAAYEAEFGPAQVKKPPQKIQFHRR